MKRVISLRWFRVLQALKLIKGRGGQHEKVVDDYVISEDFVCLEISYSPFCLALDVPDQESHLFP